ncbi:high affinity methionine permease [Leucosporidium creatinivorum]|uniref:High affinity methionine permease n=1 Tax=Leucosporidium creatinivorum TaxID=106004 RepID=A0A1Y2FCR7_9BASI|nr:high affinity methionine permease [Leucosporidium creatinivorum]
MSVQCAADLPSVGVRRTSDASYEEKASTPSSQEKNDGAFVQENDASSVTVAPTEAVSPLGSSNLNWFGILALNINMMIGTGIFSTGGSLLASLGSPGFVLLFWVLGLLIALSGLAVYLEFVHLFPGRAGGEVVWLEQAYAKPRYLFPAAFAFFSVALSFASSNCIVLATYLLYACGNNNPSDWLMRGVGIAGYTVASLCVLVSTKLVLRINEVLGVCKLIALGFIVISGFVVMAGGVKHIEDPLAAFRDPFAGTLGDGNAIANAIIKLNFAFGGYYQALNLSNEIGGKNPLKTLRWTTPLAVIIVGTLYIFATMAYFAAVPLEKIKSSGTLVAALYFTEVFGERAGARVLPALVAISAFGNLVAVLIGQSRIVREIGRQGVLPYPRIWASPRPFNTPALGIFVTWVITVIMTIAPPAGDAFNFVVDLQSYPSNVFTLLSFAGIFFIRRQRKRAGLPPSGYRAWAVAIIFRIAISLLLMIMPWVPPKAGIYGGDVSFLYCTYAIVGIGLLVLCVAYWYIWVHVLPKYRGYQIVEEVVYEEDGSAFTRLTKVWADGRRS